MELPDGYTWRRATTDDVPAVLALGLAVDVEEYGEPDWEEADVRDDFARPRFDLDRDTWLVHDATGGLVGYAGAWVKQPGELVMGDVLVHPEAPDLYPALVAAVSERAAEHAAEHAAASGGTKAHVFSSEPNHRRAAALRAAGYGICRVFRRMVIDLATPPAPPEPGPGVVVRGVTPDDLPAVYAIDRESFRDHFGFVEETYEEWYARTIESETYRPEFWWLAEVDGRPGAILIGLRHEDVEGWVRTLGTLPEARGRGAGTALLRTAFAAFHAAGLPRASLGVDSDNSTGAMGLYERAGMRAEQRYDCYERVFTSS